MRLSVCGCKSTPRPTFDARASKVDPTGTTALRVRYERDMVQRFVRVKRLIRKAIVDLDVLGMKKQTPIQQIQREMLTSTFMSMFKNMPKMNTATDAAAAPQTQEFAFERPGDKVASFMQWLRTAARQEILETSQGTTFQSAANTAWQNTYIDSAYTKGLRDAGEELAGVGKTGFGIGSFNKPIHADRVGLIYTRAYRDLEGITDEMDKQISRVLAQAMAEGRGIGPATSQDAYDLAAELEDRVDKIGITRARTLVRTEVIGAHAEAALNTYEEAGLEGVTADVEFATAGDNAVCPECQDLQGTVYTIDEARGVIPVHPNCRCAWIPVVQSAANDNLVYVRNVAYARDGRTIKRAA